MIDKLLHDYGDMIKSGKDNKQNSICLYIFMAFAAFLVGFVDSLVTKHTSGTPFSLRVLTISYLAALFAVFVRYQKRNPINKDYDAIKQNEMDRVYRLKSFLHEHSFDEKDSELIDSLIAKYMNQSDGGVIVTLVSSSIFFVFGIIIQQLIEKFVNERFVIGSDGSIIQTIILSEMTIFVAFSVIKAIDDYINKTRRCFIDDLCRYKIYFFYQNRCSSDILDNQKSQSGVENEHPIGAISKKRDGLYDSLDDNAEKAFVALLSEGDETNGFIKVKADAEDATIAAKTISETKNRNKDGRVEFYTKGDSENYDQFVYSVAFKQTETDKDVDLKADLSDISDSQFDDMHALAFNKQDVGLDMTVKVRFDGAEGQTVYVLTGSNDDDYNTIATTQIDADGNISFDTSNLDKFILTTTDVVSVREAIAKAEAEEQERIEAEKKAEEEKKAAEEAERIKAEEEKKAEEERLAAEAEVAELQRVEAEKQHKMVISGIFVGILLILGLVCFGAIKKSYNKNNNEKKDPKA